ncbi:MAG: multiheme c-type cytochrome, partial [Pirellulales bacterium]|nr:multiheme c-type cytochrome [Pirellulales bacterium]
MKKVLLLILLAVVLFSTVGVLIDYLIAVPLDATATYIGSATCAECHQQSFDRWHASPHDRAMDLATSETVLGDFNNAHLTYQGINSRMFRDGDRYMIHTEGPDGKLADFEVKYVFGFDPLQQYMVEFPDG